jgi:hypothetical protein
MRRGRGSAGGKVTRWSPFENDGTPGRAIARLRVRPGTGRQGRSVH